jgi:hypothetical protein
MDPRLERYPAARRPGACERLVGGHLIEKPGIWPPRWRLPQSRRPVSQALRCLRCGASIVVYDPPQEGVRWATPKEVTEAREQAKQQAELDAQVAADLEREAQSRRAG